MDNESWKLAIRKIEKEISYAENENFGFDTLIIGRDVWDTAFNPLPKYEGKPEDYTPYPTYNGIRVVIDEVMRDEVRVVRGI